jgi:hypothetical protein
VMCVSRSRGDSPRAQPQGSQQQCQLATPAGAAAGAAVLCWVAALCCLPAGQPMKPPTHPPTHLRDAAHAASRCGHHLDARPADAEQQAAGGHLSVQGLPRGAPWQAHNQGGGAIGIAAHAAAHRCVEGEQHQIQARIRCLSHASPLADGKAHAVMSRYTDIVLGANAIAWPWLLDSPAQRLSREAAAELRGGTRQRRGG